MFNDFNYFCNHCGGKIETPLPVEPLYSLTMAMWLIPAVTESSIRSMLYRFKDQLDEPRYRLDNKARRHRMLTASDIRFLRSKTISSGYFRSERGLPERLPKEEYEALKAEYLENRYDKEKFNDYWKRKNDTN